MSVCQVCQHDNPAGAEYCEDCGAALKSPAGAPVGASSTPAPTGGASSSGAPPAGAASGATSSTTPSSGGSASGPQSGSSASPAGTGAASASASSPDALGEAAASVGTTLSGAGDVGVESDDVETASANADAAPSTGGSPAGGAAPAAASAPAAGAAASAATAQAGGTPAGAGAPSSSTASAGAGAATPDSPAASGAQQPRLVAVRYGAPTGQEIPLLGQRLVVGRFDPETGPVDIDLSEAGEAVHISRQHGELFREADGRWMVRDLGSTNGVFVKGSADASFGPRITAPRALVSGDEITFGNARFIYRAD